MDLVSLTKESKFCETVGFVVLSEAESLPKLGSMLFSFNTERLPEDMLLVSDCTLRRLLQRAYGSVCCQTKKLYHTECQIYFTFTENNKICTPLVG